MIDRLGRYRIVEQIGQGALGVVFRAHDSVLDRAVALKVISPDPDLAAEQRERFFREAKLSARLSHPNIVTVYELAEEDGRLFMATEFLEGDTLRGLIAGRRPLYLEQKLNIIAQVCEGLQYAHHHGVIHRDITPGNVFVLENGQVKVLDFGIAQIVSGSTLAASTVSGTVGYAAPEQSGGGGDHRVDIFALGSVFYELLASRPAFGGDDILEILTRVRSEDPAPLQEIDPGLPDDVCAIVERALRKDPNLRFAAVDQMAAQIAAVRRRVVEEAGMLRSQVRAQIEKIRTLEQALARHEGRGDETVVLPGEPPQYLEPLKATNAEYAERVRRLGAALGSPPAPALEAVAGARPDHAQTSAPLREAARPGASPAAKPAVSEGEPPPLRRDPAPIDWSPPARPMAARWMRITSGRRWLIAIATVGALALGLSLWAWHAHEEAARDLQTQVVAARRLAQDARAQANLADADHLAKELFDRAQVKLDVAQKFDIERRRVEAAQGYREAIAEFERATSEARKVAGERASAMSAKTAMLEARPKVPLGALPAAGRAAERGGDAAFERGSFLEAAERYREAADLYARSAQKSPPSDFTALLARYAAAFEARDVNLIREVRCAISASELERHALVFANVKSYRLVVKIDTIKDEADEVLARGRREDVIVLPSGQTIRTPAAAIFSFKRQDDRWCIARTG